MKRVSRQRGGGKKGRRGKRLGKGFRDKEERLLGKGRRFPLLLKGGACHQLVSEKKDVPEKEGKLKEKI